MTEHREQTVERGCMARSVLAFSKGHAAPHNHRARTSVSQTTTNCSVIKWQRTTPQLGRHFNRFATEVAVEAKAYERAAGHHNLTITLTPEPCRTTAALKSVRLGRRVALAPAVRVLVLLGLAAILVRPAASYAQDEISVLAGSISSQNQWPRSYAYSLSYRNVWADYFSTTISYLNDGHFPGHHRDGVTGEMWSQIDLFDHHMTLAVGLGPFAYYDTTVAAHGGGYSDNHGWAWLYSVGATLQSKKKGCFVELRLDHTSPAKSIKTTSVSVGLGYRLLSDFRSGNTHASDALDSNEVIAFYGKTVVNSFSSQEARAVAGEFRRAIWAEARASVTVVNEGNAQLIRRSGAMLEGWLEPSFFSGRYSIGIGLGGYSAIDKYRPTPGRHVSGVVSMTMSYRLVGPIAARLNWHRIVTDYDRDTDIVLFGLGVRF